MKLLERFLRYVRFDTQSDPSSNTYPSTHKQLTLLRLLREELHDLGATDPKIDQWGYVTATVPATAGYEAEPVIGFLAHVDTSPDVSGAGVNPQIIEDYDGRQIKLGDLATLCPSEHPELKKLLGHTIITTDGSTLLGADNKAGIAIIMTAVEQLVKGDAAHGKVCIAFTPDEEIGRGTDHFNIAGFGADWAYTVDGGELGELEYDNFNGAGVSITIHGRQTHPGDAKNKMINAMRLATEIDSLLPSHERPESTEGHQGFYHLTSLVGDVGEAQMEYIIRDHSRQLFEQRKETIKGVVAQVAQAHRTNIDIVIEDQYYNMADIVCAHPEILKRARKAMLRAGITPIERPVRGGTDGARLSYEGLPCPNLFTGGANFHSIYEYCSLNSMRKAVETVINIATFV